MSNTFEVSSLELCVNCLVPLINNSTEKYVKYNQNPQHVDASSHSIDLQSQSQLEINLMEALTSIYKLQSSHLIQDFNQLEQDDHDLKPIFLTDPIGVCENCKKVLIVLYNSYKQFECLRKVDSILERGIRRLDQLIQQHLSDLQRDVKLPLDPLEQPNSHSGSVFESYEQSDSNEDSFTQFQLEESENPDLFNSTSRKDKVITSRSTQLPTSSTTSIKLTENVPTQLDSFLNGPPWLKLRRITSSQIQSIKLNCKQLQILKNESIPQIIMDSESHLNLNEIDEPSTEKASSSSTTFNPSQKTSQKFKKVQNSRQNLRNSKRPQKSLPKTPQYSEWKKMFEFDSEKSPQYKCLKCHKSYTSFTGMKQHGLFHLDAKPYKCEDSDCGKSFMSAHMLKVHQMIHKGEKCECLVCGKLLSSPINLSCHMRVVHEGDKPHLCSQCGKVFGSNATLQKHLETHSETRKYECGECGMTFKQFSCLSRHRKSIHEQKSFLCPHCGLVFKRSERLKHHVQKFHVN